MITHHLLPQTRTLSQPTRSIDPPVNTPAPTATVVRAPVRDDDSRYTVSRPTGCDRELPNTSAWLARTWPRSRKLTPRPWHDRTWQCEKLRAKRKAIIRSHGSLRGGTAARRTEGYRQQLGLPHQTGTRRVIYKYRAHVVGLHSN